jgi:DNA-binding response OmpR family regulator
MKACPNCGFKPAADWSGDGLVYLDLPNAERIVLKRLISARGAWVSNAELVEALYGNPASGGHENANRLISSHASKLSSKLNQVGWKIETARLVGYRLERGA